MVTSSVREATRADIGELVRLGEVMYTSMGVDCDDSWRQKALAMLQARLGDDIVAFVVDDQAGRLAACGAGTIALRLPAPHNPTGRAGYLQWVATDPTCRRRGHARAVMEALLAWYAERDVRVIELHATPDGEPLYRSLGFHDRGPLALRRRSDEL